MQSFVCFSKYFKNKNNNRNSGFSLAIELSKIFLIDTVFYLIVFETPTHASPQRSTLYGKTKKLFACTIRSIKNWTTLYTNVQSVILGLN